jgi:hypothetical protein
MLPAEESLGHVGKTARLPPFAASADAGDVPAAAGNAAAASAAGDDSSPTPLQPPSTALAGEATTCTYTAAYLMGRSDQYHDVGALCALCVARACVSGVPDSTAISLADFQRAWKDLKFSHIYSGKPRSGVSEGYMQQLYDACFLVAVVEMEEGDVRRVLGTLEGAGLVEGMDDGMVRRVLTAWMCQGIRDRLALFGLFCLYGAQPAHHVVLIRVEERYFPVMERFADAVLALQPEQGEQGERGVKRRGKQGKKQNESGDSFCDVLMSLWGQHAFVLGATVGFTPVEGVGRVEEESEKDRALARDLRFHLSSTLRGMGIGGVEGLCQEYKSALMNVLVRTGSYGTERGDDDVVGIADLEFGSELKRHVDVQSEKIHCTLYGEAPEGRFFAGLGKKHPSKKQRDEGVPGGLGGSGAASMSVSKVMQREKARKIDIREKKKMMEQAIGLEHVDEELVDQEEPGAVEDMPDLLDGLDDLIPQTDIITDMQSGESG